MNFMIWCYNLEKILPCGCRVSVLDTERFAFQINYCKTGQADDNHKKETWRFVTDELAEQFKISNIMSVVNA